MFFPTVSMSFLCRDGMLDRLLRQLKVAATNCRFLKTDLLLFGTLLAVYFSKGGCIFSFWFDGSNSPLFFFWDSRKSLLVDGVCCSKVLGETLHLLPKGVYTLNRGVLNLYPFRQNFGVHCWNCSSARLQIFYQLIFSCEDQEGCRFFFLLNFNVVLSHCPCP